MENQKMIPPHTKTVSVEDGGAVMDSKLGEMKPQK